MKRDTLDLFAASAVPLSNIRVSNGGLTLTLAPDGTVVFDAKFTASFSFPGTTAEADVFWRHEGTWRTEDGVLRMDVTAQEQGITEVRQNGISMAGPPLPAIPPVAGGPYRCREHVLEVTTTNGARELVMTFER